MSICDLMVQCSFNDKMADMPISSAYIKQIYCRTDSFSCARYMLVQTLGREHVPPDLFPGEMNRAKRIIARG